MGVLVAATLVLIAVALLFVWPSVEQLVNRRVLRSLPVPGSLVKLSDHKKRCVKFTEGGGGPVMVLLHGLGPGVSSLLWQKVADCLSGSGRVLMYDRAGYGWSDSVNRPTPETAVIELNELLQKLSINVPVILAGIGYGGWVARLFASTYPDKVQGLLLIDPHHEDELTGRFPKGHIKNYTNEWRVLKILAFLSKYGVLRFMQRKNKCAEYRALADSYPEDIQNKMWATFPQVKTAETAADEWEALQVSFKKVQKPLSLGWRPVTVLKTRPGTHHYSRCSEQELKKIDQAFSGTAADLADSSDCGKVVNHESKQLILAENPELVAKLILEIAEKAQECKPASRNYDSEAAKAALSYKTDSAAGGK